MPAAEARRRILAATEALLREQAFAELSVDAVMIRAGLTRTVFYRHFDDLGSVVLALLDDLRDAVMPALDPAWAPEGTDPLRATLGAGVQAYVDHGPLLAALDDAARGDPRLAAAGAAFFGAFVAETARWLRLCEDLPPVDVDELARALTLMNTGYLQQVLGRERLVEPAAALDTLHGVWARVLGFDRAPLG
jgi:AcrR family transcriptional regulator